LTSLSAVAGSVTQRFVGLSEGLSEPGKGGACTRTPGRGGGRLGALALGGLFDSLGRTLGFGEGGSERFGALGRGGPAFEMGDLSALPRVATLAGCGRGGFSDFAATGSRPATIEGGRRVAAMFCSGGGEGPTAVLEPTSSWNPRD
jgi:hypothetical protein